jgi:hypothetical protein
MSQHTQTDREQIQAVTSNLTKAFSENHLRKFRVMELRNSFSEKTTCKVQWGPMMRA